MTVESKIKNKRITEYPLKNIAISELVFDKTNPNQLTQEQMHGLHRSMERFGYLTPIVVDEDYNIADGEHRALIYKEFGLKKIPAYIIPLKDDMERRLLRQTMNKLRGQHEPALDADEIAMLYESNQIADLATLIAQQQQDILQELERYKPEIVSTRVGNDEEFDINAAIQEVEQKPPITKAGDVWQLGQHRLMCGNNQEKDNITKLLNGAKIDQLNTDPPYGVEYDTKNAWYEAIHKAKNHIQTPYFGDSVELDHRAMFRKIFDALKGSWADYNTSYIWCAGQKLHEIREAMLDADIHWGSYLVWLKNNHVLGRHDYNHKTEFCIYGWKGKHKFYGGFRTDVLEYPKPLINDLHPTMKPIGLIKQIINDGTEQGAIVLDVYAGSGSSLIACEQSDRLWYGMEIDPHYCDVIVKRWETLTGKKAERIPINQ